MGDGILLQEMVLAAIAGDLELGAETNGGAGFFSSGNGFLDVVEIGLEIHSPLVQATSGHFQESHRSQKARAEEQ